ncbi:MAG: YheV family putative zinc ribbon protein [Pseudomonadales bacterium]
MSIVKRFIAGAVCPRCSAMDSIRMYRNDIREYRECVRCDYVEGQNLDGTPEPAVEIATRIKTAGDGAVSKPKDTSVQVVRFITPDNKESL